MRGRTSSPTGGAIRMQPFLLEALLSMLLAGSILPKGAYAGTCQDGCTVSALLPKEACGAGSFTCDPKIKPGTCSPKWVMSNYTNWRLEANSAANGNVAIRFRCILSPEQIAANGGCPAAVPQDTPKQPLMYKIIWYVRPCFYDALKAANPKLLKPNSAGVRDITSNTLNPFNVRGLNKKYMVQLYRNENAWGEQWAINLYAQGGRNSTLAQDDVIYVRKDLARRFLVHDCSGGLVYSFLDPEAHQWCPAGELALPL